MWVIELKQRKVVLSNEVKQLKKQIVPRVRNGIIMYCGRMSDIPNGLSIEFLIVISLSLNSLFQKRIWTILFSNGFASCDGKMVHQIYEIVLLLIAVKKFRSTQQVANQNINTRLLLIQHN